MSKEKRRISFCPHCGNVAPQRLVYEHETTAKEIDAAGDLMEVTPTEAAGYYLAVCETCDAPVLYFYDGGAPVVEPYIPQSEVEDEQPDFYYADRVWPVHRVPAGLPDKVKQSYLGALRLKPVSPNAFALHIRICLEALCDDRGASKGRLEKRLKELAFKGEIPPTLAKITDVLRALGNVGAHDYETHLSAYDASAIDRFFRSVLEYVYVAPNLIRAYRNSAKNFGKSRDEQIQASADEGAAETEKGIIN
jgi:Domain of unknown function (DUF4145)